MTKLDIYANRHHLAAWSEGRTRTRWDYDSPDFTLDDMIAAGDTLFRACTDLLRSGDLVYVTDSINRRATFVVNLVDPVRRTVAWDIDTVHSEQVVMKSTETYTVRHRGRGRYAILNRDGKIIKDLMQSREEADRVLADLARKPEMAA